MNITAILLAPVKIVDHLLDRVVAVAGALVFSQIPVFIVQYVQRLGGHVDELTRLVGQYRDAAAAVGKPLDQFVTTHLKATTPDFIKTGEIMQENIARLHRLREALSDITGASGMGKITAFLGNIEGDIAGATLKHYTPGLSFDSTGLIMAGLGFILAVLIYWGIRSGIVSLVKKKK